MNYLIVITNVFTDSLGKMNTFEAKLHLKSNSQPRMQRWALLLSAYLKFRRTHEHSNADWLSRLSLQIQPLVNGEFTYTIGQIQALPVTSEALVKASHQDPLIAKVIHFV